MNAYYRWKYTVLLGAIIILVTLRVVTTGVADSQVAVDLFGATFLIAAILTICDSRRFRRAAFVLGIPAIVGTIATIVLSGDAIRTAQMIAHAFSIAFLGLTIALILRELLTQSEVTWDSIVGTFCGYLLVGVMWSEAYSLLQLATPGSLHFAVSDAVEPDDVSRRWQRVQYFSFATLTTVGYGDITPASPAARTLASFEAICGQFYLAVLVAGLVGVRVPQHVAAHRQEPIAFVTTTSDTDAPRRNEDAAKS